jgi:hemoglobin-like flavoprotein
MNAERKRLVLESWEAIGRNHDGVAVAFYDRLFEIDSGARSLFAKTNMVAQRGKFIQMMGEIVRNLDMPRELIPAVSALGRRHVEYGVRDADYDRVREALFVAIAAELGAGFTDDVRDAWEEAYALTAAVMKRGASTVVSSHGASP